MKWFKKKTKFAVPDNMHLCPLWESEVVLILEALSIYDELWAARMPEEDEMGVVEIGSIRARTKRVIGRLELFKNNIEEESRES